MSALCYIYIIECQNGTYYTGYTKDIKRRYTEHLQGSSKCKYTRSFPPKRLAACWQLTSQFAEALKIERAIKKLTKNQKQRLISEPARLLLIAQALALSDTKFHMFF